MVVESLFWLFLGADASGALGSMPPSLEARPEDPLRAERLASDAEMVFQHPEVQRFDDSPQGYPIRSYVSDDFSDLAFLRDLLEGVRVVQLGESGHGMGETFQLKSRLVRFLHGELGFNVVAFESNLYQCYDADRTAGDAPARTTLLNCLFGVWHVEEVLGLFEYLRETRSGPAPLRLSGIDIQPIGPNKEHRPEFLSGIVRAVDPEYASEVLARDATFLEEYGKGGGSRRAYFRQNRSTLVGAYDRLAGFLGEYRQELIPALDRESVLVAGQTARSIGRYIRQQTAPDLEAHAEMRDAGMAENLRFLLEELFPGERIVVWGHNSHVRHANQAIPVRGGYSPRVRGVSMGTALRKWLGKGLYTIGFYAYQGQVVNNARDAYVVAPAPPGTLEHRLAEGGRRVALFDLERLASSGSGGWVREPQIARYNGQVYQVLVPSQQYDALVLIADVAPPAFLY